MKTFDIDTKQMFPFAIFIFSNKHWLIMKMKEIIQMDI